MSLAFTSACAGQSGAADKTADQTAGRSGASGPAAGPGGSGLSKVLFLGDSVAAGEALPLSAAFEAAGGVEFRSAASDGGGNVVGPFSGEHWKKLPGEIESAGADVVVYQLTTYDWGTEKQQRSAYEKLLATVTRTGGKLVFVTMPPIEPGDFYAPHMAELNRAPGVARAVAANAPRVARFLDASPVWGTVYRRTRDGKADRSSDGVHTCPQGAARFTAWLLTELAELFPGFDPPDPRSWANTGWSGDRRFKGC